MWNMNLYKFTSAIYIVMHVYLFFYIQNQNYQSWDVVYLPLTFSIIIFIFTYIIYLQSDKKSSHFLIYFLLAGSVAYFSSFGNSVGSYLAMITFTISFQLSGWYFNRFTFEVLQNKRIIKRFQGKIITVNAGVLVMIISLDLLTAFFYEGSLEKLFRIIFSVYFFSNIAIPLLALVVLLMRKNVRDKTFLIWMLFIPVVAFGPFILFHALPLLFGQLWIDPYITAWGFFAIPIGYTYLILTKNLLDLTLVFNRIVYYGGLSFIPSLLIALVLKWLIPLNGLSNVLQVFTILLIVNIIFFYVKEQMDFYFRDALFRDKNNLVQFVEQLVKNLANVMTLADLENVITKEINKQLHGVVATIIKYNLATNQVQKNYLIGNESFGMIPIKQLLGEKHHTMIDYRNNIGLFLSKRVDTLHYLWIRKKSNHMILNINEKSWLIIFMSYIRLVYENIIMSEKFVAQMIDDNKQRPTSLSRFIFHISETERRRLASDIHDTILQDEIFIYRKLDELTNNDHPELTEIKEGLKQIIDKTRQTCAAILPNTLSNKGLSCALNELLSQFKQSVPFYLHYEIEVVTNKFVYYEKPIAIYRVIEELINNAIKHSEAKRVSVHIWEADEQIYIDYLDDGKGFDVEERRHADQIGLRSIVERIRSIDGSIEFSTKTPKRVQIHITIPR